MMPVTPEPETVFRSDLLEGKVVVVSGGGSGLGRAMVLQMAKLGARLAICGRKTEPLEETARLVAEAGGHPVLVQPMSIRDPDAVATFIARVWEHFGALDILVNNAGGHSRRPRSTSRPRVGMP